MIHNCVVMINSSDQGPNDGNVSSWKSINIGLAWYVEVFQLPYSSVGGLLWPEATTIGSLVHLGFLHDDVMN